MTTIAVGLLVALVFVLAALVSALVGCVLSAFEGEDDEVAARLEDWP